MSFTFKKNDIILITLLVISVLFVFGANNAKAQSKPNTDLGSKGFKIVVCDGPRLPQNLLAKEPNGGKDYVPCDFFGVMRQIQHLIDIMMIVGIVAIMVGFVWTGGLYISGDPGKIKQAKGIFPKIFTGLIMMLSAWFIVYQLLSWLTSNPGFKNLLTS
jgi:Type IV secretion system pilin